MVRSMRGQKMVVCSMQGQKRGVRSMQGGGGVALLCMGRLDAQLWKSPKNNKVLELSEL